MNRLASLEDFLPERYRRLGSRVLKRVDERLELFAEEALPRGDPLEDVHLFGHHVRDGDKVVPRSDNIPRTDINALGRLRIEAITRGPTSAARGVELHTCFGKEA